MPQIAFIYCSFLVSVPSGYSPRLFAFWLPMRIQHIFPETCPDWLKTSYRDYDYSVQLRFVGLFVCFGFLVGCIGFVRVCLCVCVFSFCFRYSMLTNFAFHIPFYLWVTDYEEILLSSLQTALALTMWSKIWIIWKHYCITIYHVTKHLCIYWAAKVQTSEIRVRACWKLFENKNIIRPYLSTYSVTLWKSR